MTAASKTKTATTSATSTALVQATTAPDAQPIAALVERWRDTGELPWAARQWAERINANTSRLQVHPMTTWASLTTAHRFNCNASLVDLPKDLSECVIVHELVQVLVPNQGKTDKGYLHTYLPDWQQIERELRHHDKEDVGKPQKSKRHAVPAPSSTKRPATSSSTAMTCPPVLVVDDEPAHRQLLRELFTLEGHEVHEAQHGGLALQQLHASTQRMVVLLGLMMPEVDGEAVLEAVAADKTLAARHAFIMVTAATGRAYAGRVAELLRQLHIPLVAKPFTVTHLVDAVEEATRQLTATSTPPTTRSRSRRRGRPRAQ
jgi:CheY-like chemotaxis protein